MTVVLLKTLRRMTTNEKANLLAGLKKRTLKGAKTPYMLLSRPSMRVGSWPWHLELGRHCLLAWLLTDSLSMIETNKCVMKRRRQKSNTWRLRLKCFFGEHSERRN